MNETRCYGCMRPIGDEPICTHCGYDQRTSNEAHRLPAGTVLKEQYLIGRVLGQGGFGITYLGWDLYLDIPVAIKEYYPSGVVMRDSTVTMDVVSCSGDDGARFRNNKERFLREAKMLARFSQTPEIVQVKNFFLANNTAYIVMEYIEGVTLRQHVKDHGRLPVAQTLEMIRPIIASLCKVHKAGLVHRDISPDNIMLLADGGLKLLDFGAVRDVGPAAVDKGVTKSTEAILKQGYAPIEQYQRHGSLGPWTDVYAMCATIYFCLTGEVPPDAPERLLYDEELKLEEKIPELQPEQALALAHGMELRATSRTASMDALLEELYPESEQPKPVPIPDPVPDPVPPKKNRWLLLAAGVAAVAALVLCITLLVGGGKQETPPAAPDDAAQSAEQTAGTVTDEGIDWSLENGVLHIRPKNGTAGSMEDYASGKRSGNISPWLDERESITAVIVEDGVSRIGNYAFANCTKLQTVELPASLREIGSSAFANSGLRAVTLPEGLEMICEDAFAATQLSMITLPDSLNMVAAGAFAEIPTLTQVQVGAQTTLGLERQRPVFDQSPVSISGYENTCASAYAAVFDCAFTSLGSAAWTQSGQCGDQAKWYFNRDCGLLRIEGSGTLWDFNGTWMQRPENAGTWVEERELAPWDEFRDEIRVASIGEGIYVIGENTFENLPALRSICFSDTTKRIAYSAIDNVAVESVYLPDSVERLGHGGIRSCQQLQAVYLSDALETLYEDAIENCTALTALHVGPRTMIGDGITILEEMTTPRLLKDYKGLTLVGQRSSTIAAYAEEHGLQFMVGDKTHMSKSDGQCGDDVYWMLIGDELILYGEGDTWLFNLTGEDYNDWALAEFPQDQLRVSCPDFYSCGYEIRHVRVLDGVNTLGCRLFSGMRELESVDLGNIIYCADIFDGCTALTSVTLPERLVGSSGWTFYNCTSLETVTILNGCDGLGEGMFKGCDALRDVYFSGQEHLLGDLGLQDAKNVTLHVKQGSEAHAYAQENGIRYVIEE